MGNYTTNAGHAHIQAPAYPSKHQKSTQDILLNNFDFLHYTQYFMPLLVEMTLEDVVKPFYFFIFFLIYLFWLPRYFDHFQDRFRPFQSTSLLKRKQMDKLKHFCHIDTYWYGGLRFFFLFSVRKGLKISKKRQKRHKSGGHIFICCVCTWAHALPQSLLFSSGDQTLHMTKVWLRYGYMKKITDKQTNKWKDRQTDGPKTAKFI